MPPKTAVMSSEQPERGHDLCISSPPNVSSRQVVKMHPVTGTEVGSLSHVQCTARPLSSLNTVLALEK